jgi:ParB-like chromosome segregation protein Spo0J
MQCVKLKTYMETGRVVFLPARAIRPNPAQPRQVFKEDALAELAESIRQHGYDIHYEAKKLEEIYQS